MAHTSVEVIAFPRIHIALADMGFASLRAYGGVGFSVAEPRTVIAVELSTEVTTHGFNSLDIAAQGEVARVMAVMVARADGRQATARLISAPPQHVGLGSKTTLLLSLISALDCLFGLHLSKEEMFQISGRGRASGVGAHAFLSGGIVWDGGHPVADTISHQPSSASPPRPAPPLMLRFPFPDEWRVALILPAGRTISGEAELNFFARHCPITVADARETMSALYHGVLPAFRLKELSSLSDALRVIHQVGFKAIEVANHGGVVSELLEALHAAGLCAGMSSMGPLLYCIYAADDRKQQQFIRDESARFRATLLCSARGQNGPAIIARQAEA